MRSRDRPRSRALPNAVKHFVAKLVKSFGRLGDTAESLDDFRYTRACLKQEEIHHGVGLCASPSLTFRVMSREVFTLPLAVQYPATPNGGPMHPQALDHYL